MSAERYVVLGLAHVRSAWFREVGRWATASSIPVEFVKTVSLDEVRVRLGSGRPYSALVVDDDLVGVDRDLAELARRVGCALVVVRNSAVERAWEALGAAATLPAGFSRAELVEVLSSVARPIARVDGAGALPTATVEASPSTPAAWRGRLVAVTGPAGAGRSTLSMALAHGLAADPRRRGLVCLADLALDADQGMLHDASDVVPGLLELVDAHRLGIPSATEVTATTWAVQDRGYRLLLGLRRHRDWTALRPEALAATLASLRRAFRCVVGEVDADLEGEAECGSVDVEDRNLLARTTLTQAELVVVIGTATLTGVHHTVRVLRDLGALGVDPARVVTVVNRAPRSPRPGRDDRRSRRPRRA